MTYPDAVLVSRACCRDTSGSLREMSAIGSRPNVIVSVIRTNVLPGWGPLITVNWYLGSDTAVSLSLVGRHNQNIVHDYCLFSNIFIS